MPNVYSIIGRQTQMLAHRKIKIFMWHRGVGGGYQGESGLGFYSGANWWMMLHQPLNPRGRSFRRANKYLCSTCWVCRKGRGFQQRCASGSWIQAPGVWRGDGNLGILRSVYREQEIAPQKRRGPKIPGAGGGNSYRDGYREGTCKIRVKPGQSACYMCFRSIFSSIWNLLKSRCFNNLFSCKQQFWSMTNPCILKNTNIWQCISLRFCSLFLSTCIMPCGKDHVNGNPFLFWFGLVWAETQVAGVVMTRRKGASSTL